MGARESAQTMTVPLQWPWDLSMDLHLEALAAKGVRSGKLSVFQARTLLGIQSRYEMDGFLKKHDVFLDLALEDVQKDADAALASSR